MTKGETTPTQHEDKKGWLGHRNPWRSPREIGLFAFAFGAIFVVVILAVVKPNIYPQMDARIARPPDFVSPSSSPALALSLYQMHTGVYPASLEDLFKKPSDTEIAGKWKGPYLGGDEMLLDAWRRPLRYRCPGRHNPAAYDLWSVGPNGIDGDADDVGNWK